MTLPVDIYCAAWLGAVSDLSKEVNAFDSLAGAVGLRAQAKHDLTVEATRRHKIKYNDTAKVQLRRESGNFEEVV